MESKRGRIRRVKHWRISLAILAALSASLALADDFKTINGKEYKNATVSRVEPDGIVIKSKSGIAKIFFVELPKEVQARFGHDPAKIEAEKRRRKSAEEKRIEEEKAAEREREERSKDRRGRFEAVTGAIPGRLNSVQHKPIEALQKARCPVKFLSPLKEARTLNLALLKWRCLLATP